MLNDITKENSPISSKKRGRGIKFGPSHLDYFIGKQIKLLRSIYGISQEELGDSLNLTFQQVQKYEKGVNRISASKLMEIAKIFNVGMDFFCDHEAIAGVAEVQSDKSSRIFLDLKNKEVYELLKHYFEIRDPKMRQEVLEVIKEFKSKQD